MFNFLLYVQWMFGVIINFQKKILGDGDLCLGESGGIFGVDVENVDVEIGFGRVKF